MEGAVAVGDNTIGSVSIKVTPDTRGFARQAKREVDSALNPEKRGRQGKYRVTVDEDYLVKSAKAVVAGVSKTLAESGQTVKVLSELIIDPKSIKQQAKALARAYGQEFKKNPVAVYTRLETEVSGGDSDRGVDIAPVVVPVVGDFSSLKRELREVAASIGEIKVRGEVSELLDKDTRKPFEIDAELSEKSIRRMRDRFHALVESLKKNEVTIRTALDNTRAAAVSSQLTQLARDRWVSIRVYSSRFRRDVARLLSDTSKDFLKWGAQESANLFARYTGLRPVWDIVDEAVSIARQTDRYVGRMATLTPAIVGALTAITGAVGTLLSAGKDAMQIINLAAMAPALSAAAASTVWVFVAAFKDFNKVFPDVVANFKRLNTAVSTSFWSAAKREVSSFFETFLNYANTYMPKIAKAWGEGIGALATGLLGRDGEGSNIARTFENIGTMVQAMTPGLNALGEAFSFLMGVGSERLPNIGRWFSDNLAAFNNWVHDAGEEKWLEWIDKGTAAMNDLFSIAQSTWQIFSQLGAIAQDAGFPRLNDVANGFQQVSEWLGRPEVYGALRQAGEGFLVPWRELEKIMPRIEAGFLSIVRLAGDMTATLSVGLTHALSGVLDGITSDKFQDGMRKFSDGFSNFFTTMTPAFQDLTEELGGFMGTLGIMAESWAPAMRETITLLTDVSDAISPGFRTFVEETGPELENLITRISPHITDIAKKAGDLLGDPATHRLVADVLDVAGNIIIFVANAVAWLVEKIQELVHWWDDLDPRIKDNIKSLLTIGGAFGVVAGALSWLLKPLAPVFGFFLRLFAGPLSGLMRNMGAKILPLVARGLGLLSRALGGLGSGISRLLGRIGGKGIFGFIAKRLFNLVPGVGWAALLLEAIHPVKMVDLAKWILEALGFGDSWATDLLDHMRNLFSFTFGDGSLLRSLLKPFGDMFAKLFSGDFVGALGSLIEGLSVGANWGFKAILWIGEALYRALGLDQTADWWSALKDLYQEKGLLTALGHIFTNLGEYISIIIPEGIARLREFLVNWQPTSGVGTFFHDLLSRLPGLLGFNDDGTWSFDTLVSSWVDFGSDLWNNHILPWLTEQWDKLVNWVKGWEPVKAVIDFFEDPLGTVVGWLSGGKKGSGVSAAGVAGSNALPANHGQTLGQKITKWLGEQWDNLKKLVLNWTPVKVVIDFFKDPLGTVMKWLGAIGGAINFGLTTLADWGSTAWGAISGWLSDGFNTVVDLITGWLPSGNPIDWIQKGKDWLWNKASDIGKGVTEAFNNAVPGVSSAVSSGVNTVAETVKKLNPVGEGGWLGKALELGANGIGALKNKIFSNASSGASGAVSGIASQAGNIGAAAKGAADKASSGLRFDPTANATADMHKMLDALKSMLTMIARMVMDMMVIVKASLRVDASSPGHYVGSTFNTGISAYLRTAPGVARGLATQAANATRVSANAGGANVGATFVNGLNSKHGQAVSSARSIASSATRSMSGQSAYSSGSSIGSTFVSGLSSWVGAAASVALNLVSAVRSKLPNSPAKEGPFSGSGWGGWGESIGEQLAKGLKDSIPEVAKQANNLMGTVSDSLASDVEVNGRFNAAANRVSEAQFGSAGSQIEPGSTLVLKIGEHEFMAVVDARAGAVVDSVLEPVSNRSLRAQNGVW